MIGWYNENEGRAYPLREDSPRVDALGRKLPDDVIADIGLVIPDDATEDVFLSALSVSPKLVSLVIGTPAEGLLIGTYPRPVTAYTPLPLESIADNVSGYVVFGHGISGAAANYRFPVKESTPFAIKALHTFDALPVELVGKLGAAAILRDIIKIEVNANVEVRYDPGGNSIVFSLAEGVRDEFVGPCARADAIACCGVPPLRSINGVVADGDGTIFVEVH